MRKHWVTNLRVMATLTVILLHAAGYGSLHIKKLPATDWWICHIINVFGRFAVPVFVMLSGYLLIGRYEALGNFLKKRLSRIFVPFIIWSLIYMVWSNFRGIASERTPWTAGDFLEKLLTGSGGGSGHLWFVYMLLGIYAFTPIVSRWIKGAEADSKRNTARNEILFFLALWLAGNVIYTLVHQWFGFEIAFDIRYFTGFAGYFILGYWLGNKDIKLPNSLLAGVFLAAWALTAWICYVVSWEAGKYIYDYTDYLSLPVILMSVSMFLLFKQAGNRPFLPGIMRELDMTSYGVYLVHALALRILSRQYHLNFTWKHPLAGIGLQFLLALVASYLVVKIISKIPKAGSWIVG